LLIFCRFTPQSLANQQIVPTFAIQFFRDMANHKATKKDSRQNRTRNERNRYNGKTTRNAMRELLANKDKAAAGTSMPVIVAMLDKLAKRNVIHKNKAANLKSAVMKHVASLA
jgi:small subunit ribosomal protein S20